MCCVLKLQRKKPVGGNLAELSGELRLFFGRNATETEPAHRLSFALRPKTRGLGITLAKRGEGTDAESIPLPRNPP